MILVGFCQIKVMPCLESKFLLQFLLVDEKIYYFAVPVNVFFFWGGGGGGIAAFFPVMTMLGFPCHL